MDFFDIVIDNGTEVFQAGFAGDDTCQCVLPTQVKMVSDEPKERRDGQGTRGTRKGRIFPPTDECIFTDPHDPTSRSPIQRGQIVDWDSMEQIWDYSLTSELGCDLAETRVFMTDSPSSTRYSREKTAQIVFECFPVPSFYLSHSSKLALFASGRGTGLILDSGAGVTHATPMYEFCPFGFATQRLDIGGADITQWIDRELLKRNICKATTTASSSGGSDSTIGGGRSFSTFLSNFTDHRWTICQSIKHQSYQLIHDDDDTAARGRLLKLFQDHNQKRQTRQLEEEGWEVQYLLPDDECISIVRDICRMSPKPMLEPAHVGLESPGVVGMIAEAIAACDDELHRDLLCNIVLAGGNTMWRGFEKQIEKGLYDLLGADPSKFGARPPIKVIAPPERQKTVWIGGSIEASLSSFQERWVTRAEYDENGPGIVHTKCFSGY